MTNQTQAALEPLLKLAEQAASPPCGACRQVLAEFILPDAPVAFPTKEGTRIMPFSEVLPLGFEMKLK
ncbi:MAG: hypothetical protein ABR957_06135 [Terracidiphilus sp.]